MKSQLLSHLNLILGNPLTPPLILAGGHGHRDLILWLDRLLSSGKFGGKKPGKNLETSAFGVLEVLKMAFLMVFWKR